MEATTDSTYTSHVTHGRTPKLCVSARAPDCQIVVDNNLIVIGYQKSGSKYPPINKCFKWLKGDSLIHLIPLELLKSAEGWRCFTFLNKAMQSKRRIAQRKKSCWTVFKSPKSGFILYLILFKFIWYKHGYFFNITVFELCRWVMWIGLYWALCAQLVEKGYGASCLKSLSNVLAATFSYESIMRA